MCKSMNALFCPFMDKEQESSFWTNCPEVQIKKKEDTRCIAKIVVIPIIDGYYIRNNA